MVNTLMLPAVFCERGQTLELQRRRPIFLGIYVLISSLKKICTYALSRLFGNKKRNQKLKVASKIMYPHQDGMIRTQNALISVAGWTDVRPGFAALRTLGRFHPLRTELTEKQS